MSELRGNPYVALTLDGCTTRRTASMLGVIAHYKRDQGGLRAELLDLRFPKGKRAPERIRRYAFALCVKWGITSKVVRAPTDNAASMRNAFQAQFDLDPEDAERSDQEEDTEVDDEDLDELGDIGKEMAGQALTSFARKLDEMRPDRLPDKLRRKGLAPMRSEHVCRTLNLAARDFLRGSPQSQGRLSKPLTRVSAYVATRKKSSARAEVFLANAFSFTSPGPAWRDGALAVVEKLPATKVDPLTNKERMILQEVVDTLAVAREFTKMFRTRRSTSGAVFSAVEAVRSDLVEDEGPAIATSTNGTMSKIVGKRFSDTAGSVYFIIARTAADGSRRR